jgi:hypothetical protein
MRRRAKADAIPEDLQTYEPLRWCQDAIDHGDPFIPPRLRGRPCAELLEDWYVPRVVAPARYRAALWDAVGQRAGDHHFYEVLGVHRATSAAGWPD